MLHIQYDVKIKKKNNNQLWVIPFSKNNLTERFFWQSALIE